MKLATLLYQGTERVGVVSADQRTVGLLPRGVAMIDLIGRTVPEPAGPAVPMSDLQLLAPIPSPIRSILCVGKNYQEHAQEFVRSGFDVGGDVSAPVDPDPVIFSKLASSVVGSGTDVQLHPVATSQVDYEGEIAVIIGRAGTRIPEELAMGYVWGYTLLNDVTARDLQKRHRQWTLGKSLDTFCPMGPWITTADEVESQTLGLTTHVNGELRQQCVSSQMIHGIAKLIATLSAGIELKPGDIIATGTPVGVGIGFDPPRFLAAGDTVAISSPALGTLTNRFV